MGISDMHVIPMIITCMLQGTLCDTGIPCTFYGGNICSVGIYVKNARAKVQGTLVKSVGLFLTKIQNRIGKRSGEEILLK